MVEDSIKFRDELMDGYNKCFPQKRKRIKRIDLKKPWLDDETLKGKIKERNRLYTLKLKTTDGCLGVYDERLRLLSSEVSNLRHYLKKTFFAQRLSEAGKNSKAAWRVLHEFIGKLSKKRFGSCRSFSDGSRIITKDSDIAETFCYFFANIGP